MAQFLILEHSIFKDRWKKLFEKSSCTCRISFKKQEYLWIVYENVLSGKITGLCLYNITAAKEVTDRHLIGDMLKLLFAYVGICGKKFKTTVLCQTEKRRACWDRTEREIIELKGQVEREAADAFPVGRKQVARLLGMLIFAHEKETEMLEILEKYCTFAGRACKSAEEVFPVRLFLDFYKDLYRYRANEQKIRKAFAEGACLIGEVGETGKRLREKNAFTGVSQLAQRYKDSLEEINVFKDYRPISQIFEHNFEESIVDPYWKLVRNKMA